MGRALRPLAEGLRPNELGEVLAPVAQDVRRIALPVGTTGAAAAIIGAGARKLGGTRQKSRLPVRPVWPRTNRTTALKRTFKQAQHLTSGPLPRRQDAIWLALGTAGAGSIALARRGRRIPIQCSIDVAVPLEVAYEEWMALEFLPEGAHRVQDISLGDAENLSGRVKHPLGARKWEAEILDQRRCESFAWRSAKGSDCAGLITFHRLDERLTRLELQLDVVPVRPVEAAELMLRLADRRAQAELRRFKARLETINPDAYGTGRRSGPDEDRDLDEQDDHDHKEA